VKDLNQMRIFLLLVGLALCGVGCDSKSSTSSESGKIISTDETRQVAMHVLLNRYPEAQIVDEQINGATATYRCATNGTMLPVVVVVDRKAAKAHFEKVKR
jgi:hypothetical protein